MKFISRFLSSVILVTVLGPLSFAQNSTVQGTSNSEAPPDSSDSIAAAARRTKAHKDHAKKVITDDDVKPGFGPLPRLKLNEAENDEEVVAAVLNYKQTHTPEETEIAVRRWYDEYDKQLEQAIERNLEIKALRGANLNNSYDLCQKSQDYRQCQILRNQELNGARYDQSQIAQNSAVIVHLQHSLVSIRNHLIQIGLHYDWFKVRTTNNIDKL